MIDFDNIKTLYINGTRVLITNRSIWWWFGLAVAQS